MYNPLWIVPILTFCYSFPACNGILDDDCGYQATFEKIIDGEYTAIDEFPWLARIGYKTQSSDDVIYLCGGALISSRVVLTAGHCVAQTNEVNGLIVNNVILGEYDSTTDVDCVRWMGFIDCADPLQNIPVDDYELHHNYLEGFNDIALIYLRYKVNFTEFVRPICLPPKNDSVEIGDNFLVSGWGKTESTDESSIKLKASLPITNFTSCAQQYYDRKSVVLHPHYHLCAGMTGKDSCTGDSGLPLMSDRGDGRWRVYGITSRGNGCGKKTWPGVYTRVSSFLDWIESRVEQK